VAAAGSLPALAATAEEALGKYSCAACHTMLGTESPVGPALTDVGKRLDINEIRQSIIDPNAVAAEGFVIGIMPADFADRMMVRELEMIVQFLADQKG
ncbi:MAG: c-type cytochrome, partial [Gammaproteobacteria bacterium]|nr:c-type cytochrome [Gammaproteobacteria bacterium]